MLPSSVIFVTKSFLDFTIYDNKTQHGFPIKTTNVELGDISNDVDDMNIKKELRSSQPFLVDSELEWARYKVFNYAIVKLKSIIVEEKLDQFLNN